MQAGYAQRVGQTAAVERRLKRSALPDVPERGQLAQTLIRYQHLAPR
jgi:hypothetical protein